MKKNLQDIDKLFTQFLKDYTEEPPTGMWQQIENDLNRKDAEKYRTKYGSLKETVTCILLTCICLLLSDALQFPKHKNIKTAFTYKSLPAKSRFEERYNSNKKTHKNNNEKRKRSDTVLKETFINVQATGKKMMQDFNEITLYNPVKTYSKTQESLLSLSLHTNIKADTVVSSIFITDALKNKKPLSFIQEPSTKNMRKIGINSISITKQKNSFYIIPFASIDHISERLKQEYEYDNEDKSAYATREKPDMSYTTGLLFEYGLSNKIALQTGILLSNSFTNVLPTVVNALPDNSGNYKFKLATSYGFAEIKKAGTAQQGDSISITHAMIRLQYISVPLLVKMNFKQRKLNISGTMGAAFNSIQKDEVEVDYATANVSEIESIGKIEGVKNYFFVLVAGAEASYPLNKNISIGVNPVLRYAITPVNKGTPVKAYPVNLGIGASVRIKF